MAMIETSYKLTAFSDILPALRKLFETDLNEANYYIRRYRVEIPEVDLLGWLYHQKSATKIFWSSRDYDIRIAGIGVADQLELDEKSSIEATLALVKENLAHADERVRYFGGFKFDIYSPTEPIWNDYNRGRLVVPRFELEIKNQKTYLAVNFKPLYDDIDEILDEIEQINFVLNEIPAFDNKLVSRTDYPDKKGWDKNLSTAFASFANGEYQKIVMARRSQFEFEKKINPQTVLNLMTHNTPNCFNFCFQFDERSSFVGASPERLYYRKRNQIECEAIAGTRARRENDDQQTETELLNSEKDVREHRYVVNSIKEALAELTSNGELQREHKVGVVRLSRLMHLISRFKLTIKDEVGDFELLNSLHPTAAVGGYPQKATLYKINELEQFDRGWYAAPVGWISKERSEFSVAIRSGLICDNSIYLYSGAGIVDGSQSDDEWVEIENKIGNFLKALGL